MLEILYASGVNVANMTVARGPDGPNNEVMARCFMALDDDVSTNAITSIRSLEILSDVSLIRLQ